MERTATTHGPDAREAAEPQRIPARSPAAPADWVLGLQRSAGNHAVARLAAAPGATLARFVPYNAGTAGNDVSDPEQAAGTLPFAEDGSWDGVAIAQQMSQIQPGPDVNENIRCVETSAIAAIAQQGPAAIRRMMVGYVARYEGMLRGNPGAALRRRITTALENLRGIDERIQDRTATFADISLLQREMFMVFGSHGIQGTDNPNSAEIMRREGYRVRFVNQAVGRTRLARWAADLQPGEVLDCGVSTANRRGVGDLNHAVHLGRLADGRLYFYNPAPVQGDQMIFPSDDLTELDGYFVNRRTTGEEPEADATGAVGAPETAGAVGSRRTFMLIAKYTPPADASAAEGRLAGE